MKERFNYILIILLFPVLAGAQSLPVLKQSAGISSGTLRNGTSYYIVTNDISKGYADFALVQKNYVDPETSARLLLHQENFSEVAPYRFLASKGIKYTRNGFFTVAGNSTVFSFRDVPVFDKAASDSTLLVLTGVMRECPTEQAVVISGDVDVSTLRDRLEMLSMTVPRIATPGPAVKYEWKSSPEASFRFTPRPGMKSAAITVSFRSPRTPDGLLKTAQPLVTSMFAAEMGTIVKNRIRQSFFRERIPLAGVTATYRNSASGPGDEMYTFSVVTDTSSILRATATISSILGSLDAHGASAEEYGSARRTLLLNTRRASSNTALPNSFYTDRCISAFLYGSSLAEDTEFTEFYIKRSIDPARELSLFNNYMGAALNPDRDVTVSIDGSGREDRASVEPVFLSNWLKASADSAVQSMVSHAADTLALAQPRTKAKLKSSSSDPVTGGKIWLFSNGVKVIYKKVPTPGQCRYSMVIRGGSSLVRGIAPGESAFVGDMLELYSVAGLKPADFRGAMFENGITMDCKVSVSDLRISGSAPSDRVGLLLRALVSVANSHSPDKEAFAYYRDSEALRIERMRTSGLDIGHYLDSLHRPEYKFLEIKNASRLADALPQKAWKYFDSQFSRVNDGAIILVGDMDESSLQKLLCRYVGAFRTTKSYYARPKVSSSVRGGWYSFALSREEVGTGKPCVGMSLSAEMPFSMDDYMTFRVACLALERAVTEAMAPLGMTAGFTYNAEILPAEQFSLKVILEPAEASGLPYGVVPGGFRKAQDALRKAVSTVSRSALPEAVLNGYKAEVTSRIASSLRNPSELLEMSETRYSFGKDMVSGHENHMKSVTSESVCRMVRLLEEGAKTEMIVR